MPPIPGECGEPRQRISTGILMPGTLMGSLDATIVTLALPIPSEDLHADRLTPIWIILINLLVVAVSTTQLGRPGDIHGGSRMRKDRFWLAVPGSVINRLWAMG